MEEEADLAGDRGPGPVGDPPPHDPPLPLLRQPEGGVRPALVRLPDVGVEGAPVPGRVIGQVREVVERAAPLVRLEGHRGPVLEPPDDEGSREGLRHAESGREVGHLGVESLDVLPEFAEDEVAAHAVLGVRVGVVDEDESQGSGRVPAVDPVLPLPVDIVLEEEGLAPRIDVSEGLDRLPVRAP